MPSRHGVSLRDSLGYRTTKRGQQMAYSLFTDKTHPPSVDEMQAALGTKRPLWDRLTQFIEQHYRAQGALKFYGKNYGWMLAFRHAGKALLALYPGDNRLVVQIILETSLTERALELPLGETARQTLEQTPPLREGRWLFIPVDTERDVEDIERLLLVKACPKQTAASIPKSEQEVQE